MGDTNEPQDQPQGWAAFADAFAGGDMDPVQPEEGAAGDGAGEAPAGGDGAAAGGEPAATPPTPAAAAPATPATPEQPVPTWAGQEEAGRAFKDLRGKATQAETEAAYWKAVAEGRIPNPNAQPATPAQPPAAKDEDPEPDPSQYTDDAAYWKDVRAWDRRQVAKELRAEMAPIAQTQQRTATQANLDAHKAQVGAENWARYWQAVDNLSNDVPGLVQQILGAKDPGAEVLKLGRRLLGEQPGAVPAVAPVTPAPAAGAAGGAPVQPATPAVPAIPLNPDGTLNMAALAANPAMQEAMLQAVAAQRAAAGAPPPTNPNPTLPPGPKGLGPVGGAASPDGTPTLESIQAMKDPQQLGSLGAQLFAGLMG